MTIFNSALYCNNRVSNITYLAVLYTLCLHEIFVYRIVSEATTIQNISFTNTSNNFTNKMSGEGDRNLNIDYNGLLEAQKDKKILIIDVREDSEINETGKLPGSIHIPMGHVSTILLNLSNQEFEQKFNREKPDHNTTIILSCRSGRRSASVQSELQKLGYTNAVNYSGGYLDWQSNQNNSTL